MSAWQLNGRTVMVTGAESGLGRAIAMRLLTDGANVAAAGIDKPSLADFARHAYDAGHGERLLTVPTDIRDAAAVTRMAEAAAARFGCLDAAVANAGIMVQRQPFVELEDAAWQTVLDVNLTGTFNTLQAAARIMERQDTGGHLLVTASSNSLRPSPQTTAYVASKAAVHHMVRALALELAPQRIRVNAIVPGLAHTPGTMARAGHVARSLQSTPMGEIVEPEEIAAIVAFALSDEAPLMTGVDLKIDSGRTSG